MLVDQSELRELVSACLGRTGASQRAFADEAKITQAKVSRFLSGKRVRFTPDEVTAIRLVCQRMGGVQNELHNAAVYFRIWADRMLQDAKTDTDTTEEYDKGFAAGLQAAASELESGHFHSLFK